MTFVKEDLGMLWFEDDQLICRGDAAEFAVRRDQRLAIDRGADAERASMNSVDRISFEDPTSTLLSG